MLREILAYGVLSVAPTLIEAEPAQAVAPENPESATNKTEGDGGVLFYVGAGIALSGIGAYFFREWQRENRLSNPDPHS